MNKPLFSKIIYGITILLAVVSMVCFINGDIRYNHLNKDRLQHIQFIGTFHIGNDREEQPLTVENLNKVGAVEDLTMTGHVCEDVEENEQLFIYLRRISVEVYKNGIHIYSYGGNGTHLPNVRSAGNVWCSFFSEGLSTEDELTLKFHNPYPRNSAKIYSVCLQRFYVGDKMELFLHMIGKQLHIVVICMLILLSGIELLILGVTLRIMHIQQEYAIFYCGMFFIASSIWLLVDYSYISLIIPRGMTLDVVDTLVFMSIPILGLGYGQNYLNNIKIKKIFFALEHILLFTAILYMVLQGFGMVDGEMMQELFMFLLPVTLGITFICLFTDIRKNEDACTRLVLFSGMLLIIAGTVGYIWYEISGIYGITLFGVGLGGFALIQYVIVMLKFKERHTAWVKTRDLEKELVESRVAIMLSQIQPHFLYNSISCIQELCLMEPRKAYDALAQFAHFLRGNMDSLTSTEPIPFEQELRHVKNYLALEKIRFDERLSVVYQIDEEGFFIPALTIQPMVENAVRYGISKKRTGGTVTISTHRREDKIVVTIADDGVGFDLSKPIGRSDGRSHIGIENVRKRLKSQCNGRLEINSSPKGTVVDIFLPVN